jgi:hypothetical protein
MRMEWSRGRLVGWSISMAQVYSQEPFRSVSYTYQGFIYTEGGPVNGDEYMELLEQRRAEAEAAARARRAEQDQLERFRNAPLGVNPQITTQAWVQGPLLEHFVRPGDEDLLDLPDPAPAPNREPHPRVYRSAASLREERDRLQARRAAHIDSDNGSPAHDAFAIVNVSTQSRNRAARASGRRRFAGLDRELKQYAALTRRIQSLDSRIAKAEAREARPAALSARNPNPKD